MSGTLFGVTVMSLRAPVPLGMLKNASRLITGRDSVQLAQQNHWEPITRPNTRERTVAKGQVPRGKQSPLWAGTAM